MLVSPIFLATVKVLEANNPQPVAHSELGEAISNSARDPCAYPARNRHVCRGL